MVLYVDILDACNLKCKTCVRGLRGLANSSRQMPLDKFKFIIEKAVSEGFECVGLFNWTEPFLVPNLHEYVSIVTNFGLQCHCSSNMSLKYISGLEASLSGIQHLTVSVSGFDQEVYEVNHAGGNIEWVKENLQTICNLKRAGRISTQVVLRLIRFDYNQDQEHKLKHYAATIGLDFEVIDGSGHPINGDPKNYMEAACLDALQRFDSNHSFENKGEVCSLIFETVALDAEGDVFLCCAQPNYNILRIGSYLTLSMNEVLISRFIHPRCSSCGWQRR
jgi:molybdenum cofactor biosynthesis enzyme MoaA